MEKIPFMRPKVVKKDTYLSYLDRIDVLGVYTNNGPLNALLETRIISEVFDDKALL